ncbi:MAG: phosphoribosyltransferase family protein [Sulfurovum sp.]|nr:phosphoribosyltransferase family protein [Sulfurovum sp.]
MKVLTLSQEMLEFHAKELYLAIEKDNFHADIIIGVATGGVYVSRPIHTLLKQSSWQGQYHEITLSRASSKVKKTFRLKMLLRYLPYALLNLLRVVESTLFERLKPKIYSPHKEKQSILSSSLIVQIKEAQSILLIDDAIDTGATLLAIKNVIQSINVEIQTKIAVLTVTHKAPYIQADYSLFDRVLLRCPWAEDYKGSDKIG